MIGRSIYTGTQIADAVERLASTIAADYRGQPLLLLGVLKGALCFTTDLARRLSAQPDGPSEIIVDYLCAARPARLVFDASVPLGGANVLLADGIVDKGQTLAFLQAFLKRRQPRGLRTCVLFDKRSARQVDVPIEYVGLPVPNRFVVGYGLDYKEDYRNLAYLAELGEGLNGLTST